MPPTSAARWKTRSGRASAKSRSVSSESRQVEVALPRGEDVVPLRLEPLDEMRAEKASAAGDEGLHRCVRAATVGRPVLSQSTRPIQRSRFSAYQAIVFATPSSHETCGSQPRLAVQLLVADAQRHHLARSRAHAQRRRHDLAVAPVALLAADAQDERRPSPHRDVLALAVDVDVAGDAFRGDGEVAANAVGAEAEVAQRLERAELDRLALERLRDDRARHVARVLARPVVVEHARDDAGQAVRVVVVHRQEVGGDLRRRVDRLGVDRRALVQDQRRRRRRSRGGARRPRGRCRTPPRCPRCRTSRARARCRRSTGAG